MLGVESLNRVDFGYDSTGMATDNEIADQLERLSKAVEQVAAVDAEFTRAAYADARDLAADARDAAADERDTAADARDLATNARMSQADRQTRLAEHDSEEYNRALYHYTQLVRHRIANPLQIIAGMADTLLHNKSLDPTLQRDMLAAIEDQANLLERLSLFHPDLQGDEERDLHPRPFE